MEQSEIPVTLSIRTEAGAVAPEPIQAVAGLSMAKAYKVGAHVSWNSEAGRVRGTIIRVHTKDVNYKGYTHHASPDDPQYEIKSDKTDHVALHKGRALRLLSGARKRARKTRR